MKAAPTDLAWLGGYLDGEGTIGISRTNGKAWKHPYLRPLVQAPNTDIRLSTRMADICEMVTGKRPSIVKCGATATSHRAITRVKVSTQWELLLLLPAVMPYLVAKKRQAELALEFSQRRHLRLTKHWYQHKDLDELAYQECLILNERGASDEVRADKLSHLRLVQEN